MNKKPTLLVKVIAVFLLIIGIFSISVVGEISQLSSIHTLPRILDILFRTVGGILSLVAVVGLWKMRMYGYISALLASFSEILLRLFIFFPHVKPNVLLLKFTNILGIITFLLIIFYFYKNRRKFR